MSPDAISKAKTEARRFLEKVSFLETHRDYQGLDYSESSSMPRQTGAVRRASMDLTRALADLRRPR